MGNCYDNAKHYQVLGNLLESAVQNPSFDPSARPFMHTIFAVVVRLSHRITYLNPHIESQVLESFTNPNVHLGPWFWQAFSLLSEGGRPLKSGDGTSFASLDIGTMGEMSCFIRDPDKYLYQIRCTYALIQTEQPRLIEAVGAAVAKARESGSTAQERRLGIRFHTANAAMLTMASILNRIIRSYDDDPVLLEEAKGYVDDIIVLGQDASSNRPIAASAVATPLTVALAVLEDYRYAEVQELLLEYQTDFAGLHYFSDMLMIKKQFERIDVKARKKMLLLTDKEDIEDIEDIDTAPACAIL